jgi:Uma2 family endonuclease
VFIAPCDVFFSEHNVVEPDIFFVSRGRHATIERQLIRGAPELVVEVLSPGTTRRDRLAKRQLYAQFGVDHYWLVDPMTRSIEIYVLKNGEFDLTDILDSRAMIRPVLFPDLSIPVAEIWD